jgi:CheY-like chemotaxis protein/anti-sigma regulatory factor (Ser/Thr protein kinase)
MSPVSGDPDRIQQIIWNLITNSIKFTPRNGRVEVKLERIHSHIEVTVSDTGQGIAPEFLHHVFERFRQSDSSSTRTHGGLGLGLSIVSQLVELHGGSITAESPGKGMGTVFKIVLPLLSIHSEARNRETSDAGEQQILTDRQPSLQELRVLVVDDEPDARDLIATVLTGRGAEVVAVESADEALQELEQQRFDVLISDIGMPLMDGYGLIERVRQLPIERGGRIPAAALTAYAGVEDRMHLLSAGYQIHIPKPVEPAELATVVASLAERYIGPTSN